jgi:2-methylcitrate dehydratase PrpD
VAVVKGTTGVAAFRDAARQDARVSELAARVEVSGDDTMSLRGGPDQPTGRVSVELRDGRRLTRETALIHGDAANPRPRHELEAKFRALASEALDAARVQEIVGMVARLDQLKNVGDLTALLAPAS